MNLRVEPSLYIYRQISFSSIIKMDFEDGKSQGEGKSCVLCRPATAFSAVTQIM